MSSIPSLFSTPGRPVPHVADIALIFRGQFDGDIYILEFAFHVFQQFKGASERLGFLSKDWASLLSFHMDGSLIYARFPSTFHSFSQIKIHPLSSRTCLSIPESFSLFRNLSNYTSVLALNLEPFGAFFSGRIGFLIGGTELECTA